MANNYLFFSEEITNLTPEETEWIETELAKEPEKPEDYDDLPDFEWKVCSNPDGTHSLWLYSEEYSDPAQVAGFVQAFLKKFRPTGYFELQWAETCSKPRIGEFGGGAVFVTATDVDYWSAGPWLAKKRNAFREAKAQT